MLHHNCQGKLNPKYVYSREKHANHCWSYDKEALLVAGPSSCFKKGFQLNPVGGSLLPPVTRTLRGRLCLHLCTMTNQEQHMREIHNMCLNDQSFHLLVWQLNQSQ